jgi:hypothetical protein
VAKAIPSEVTYRIVMITPSDRHTLPALMQSGFIAYLVKPVRAASLAARLGHEQPRARLDRVQGGHGIEPSLVPDEPKSILIAEDNEINALLARALVEKMGHRAEVVADGAQAVEAWRAARAAGRPFDLVLMDLHMPGVDGFLLRQDVALRHGGFYTAGEFDIDDLVASHPGLHFLELGRSCVLQPYRNKRTVELLWRGIWTYVCRHRLDVMIGCARPNVRGILHCLLPP